MHITWFLWKIAIELDFELYQMQHCSYNGRIGFVNNQFGLLHLTANKK